LTKFTVTIHRKEQLLTKEVEKDSFTIGRSLDCDLSLNDSHVSRVHLVVSRRWNQIWIEDKNSSNGTFINGTKMIQGTPVNVVSTDRIQMGRSEFILVIDLETEEVEPVIPEPEPEPMIPQTLPTTRDSSNPSIPLEAPAAMAAPEPKHEETIAMPAPAMAPFQAEKILHEAKRNAAQIVLEAEKQAEKRTQAIYQKARDAQAQAEIFYQTRMTEAHKEADAILADYQRQGRELLQDARKMAQELREEVDVYVQNLRSKAKADADDHIAEATLNTEKMKTEALEAARITAQNENAQRIKDSQDEAERILDFAKLQAQQIQDQLKSEKDQLAEATSSLASIKDELERAQSALAANRQTSADEQTSHDEEVKKLKALIAENTKNEQSLKTTIDELTKKNASIEEHSKKLHEKQAHLSMEVKDLEAKKDHLFKEFEAQKIFLNEKLEKEKSQIARSEEERLEDMRMEMSKRLQKMEQDLIEDVMLKRLSMVKDIHMAVEREAVKVMAVADWDKVSQQINEKIKEAVEGRVATISQSSATTTKPADIVKKRKNEKVRWTSMGLAMGALAYFASQVVVEKVQKDNNPLQSRAVAEAKQRQEDLERRKFNPPQAEEVKDTYTDSVIYTRNFSEIYADQDYQQRLYKATAQYLLKTWRIDEDRSLQVLAASSALVKELQDRRTKIHPDFIKDGLDKMRIFENQTVARMKDILGSEVRLESFRRFEKNFYRDEVNRRRMAQSK
jgi:pSer/pThr/pTyr-binding forkhead associated (FHA) protein